MLCIRGFERGRTNKHDRSIVASSAFCRHGKAVSFVISLVSVHRLSIVICSMCVGLHFLLKLYISLQSRYLHRQLKTTNCRTQTVRVILSVTQRRPGAFPQG